MLYEFRLNERSYVGAMWHLMRRRDDGPSPACKCSPVDYTHAPVLRLSKKDALAAADCEGEPIPKSERGQMCRDCARLIHNTQLDAESFDMEDIEVKESDSERSTTNTEIDYSRPVIFCSDGTFQQMEEPTLQAAEQKAREIIQEHDDENFEVTIFVPHAHLERPEPTVSVTHLHNYDGIFHPSHQNNAPYGGQP